MLLAFTVALLVAAAGNEWPAAFWWLLGLGLALMVLGVMDDILDLGVWLRFILYAFACLLASWLLLQKLMLPALWWWPSLGLATLVLLWCLNLYNFMDGIDGIAAIQAIIALGGVGLLVYSEHGPGQYAEFCWLLAASQLGFLCWNWPPARLFMGDAGSVPTGFLLAALALLGAVENIIPLGCWLVLLAVFICDASWTLTRRILARERFTQAHRQHAYQRLSRYWGNHLKVDLLLVAIAVFWLLPIAWLIQTFQRWDLFLVILAYLPLLFAMAKIRNLA